jgi:hypothetical protein
MIYIAAVHAVVGNDLRCREQGLPAPWVSHALHASVIGAPLDIGVAPQHWSWIGRLRIPVTSTGGASVMSDINGHLVTEYEDIERQAIEQPNAGTPFNQWEALKKLAHQELDTLLESLRDKVETKTSDWPRMYQKGRTTRTQTTMPKLVRWLVSDDELFDGDQTATSGLLKELKLDAPRYTKKL